MRRGAPCPGDRATEVPDVPIRQRDRVRNLQRKMFYLHHIGYWPAVRAKRIESS